MSFERDPSYWLEGNELSAAHRPWTGDAAALARAEGPLDLPHSPGSPITFCSCILDGTKVEQNPTKREIVVMWLKDAAAGAGLVLFMVTSFVLASGAHAALNHL